MNQQKYKTLRQIVLPKFDRIPVLTFNSCRSTNDPSNKLLKGDVWIRSKQQTNGRGQRGALWFSGVESNLFASLHLQTMQVPVKEHYRLNMACCLAVLETVKDFVSCDVFIKWPNDIYVGRQKVSGILLESIVSSRGMTGLVFGIGVNVNEKEFKDGLNATSIFLHNDKKLEVKRVFKKLRASTEYFMTLFENNHEMIEELYHKSLMFKGEEESFYSKILGDIEGIIQNVNCNGELVIKDSKTGEFLSFQPKEIVFKL